MTSLVTVADTGPICYLVLIGEVELLPTLFGRIYIPNVVADELDAIRAPGQVRDWIAERPSWLSVDPTVWSNRNPRLDAGEEAAIELAGKIGASILLIDDRAGARAAMSAGLEAFGTLGILDRASKRGLIDLPDALAKLLRTNFRVRRELIEALLDQDR